MRGGSHSKSRVAEAKWIAVRPRRLHVRLAERQWNCSVLSIRPATFNIVLKDTGGVFARRFSRSIPAVTPTHAFTMTWTNFPSHGKVTARPNLGAPGVGVCAEWATSIPLRTWLWWHCCLPLDTRGDAVWTLELKLLIHGRSKQCQLVSDFLWQRFCP